METVKFLTSEECRVELVAYTKQWDKGYEDDGTFDSNFLPVSAARASFGREDKTGEDPKADLKLMKYLADHQHLTPFEYNHATFLVECPLFIRSQIMRHRTFCVAGDSVLRLCSNGNIKVSRYKTIAEVWENWHEGVKDSHPKARKVRVDFRKRFNDYRVWYVDCNKEQRLPVEVGVFSTKSEADKAAEPYKETYRARKIPSCQNLHAVSMDEDTRALVSNRVLSVTKSGVKSVWKVRVSTGAEVKATEDHEFRTPEGYVKLRDLRVGGIVLGAGRIYPEGRDPLVSHHLRQGIGHWTARMRETLIPSSGASCYICGASFPKDALDLDHIVPVVEDLSLALTPSNLAPSCKACHRNKTDLEQKKSHRKGAFASAVDMSIVSIEYAGEEMTYDLSMEAPNHNFIANGFVVHNCYNEISRRYTSEDISFWKPDNFRKQSKSNKQASTDEVIKTVPVTYHTYRIGEGRGEDTVYDEDVMRLYEEPIWEAWLAYDKLVSGGVCREQARAILPQSLLTRFYMGGSLRNFVHFLKLRLDSHAQREVQIVARKIESQLRELWPEAMGVLLPIKETN